MKKIVLSFVFGGSLLFPLNTLAASCCGGGSASSLILPKTASSMLDYSVSYERYEGSWNTDGQHVENPPGSDLNQYRTSLGVAYRLANRWQASLQVPYVWNKNQYQGIESNSEGDTSGLGDSTLGVVYETFDDIKCIWKVTDWKSLIPAVYIGSSLTIPTGKSAHSGDITNTRDITGRGSYRLDANILLDKTIYPWNMSVQASYGKYLERAVNQEPNRKVEPYDKALGDRTSTSISFGHTSFLASLSTLTVTTSFNDLREKVGKVNGVNDDSFPSMKKQSLGLSFAYSTPAMDWIYKLSFNHALHGNGRGKNFPTTDVINLGLSYVIR